MPSPLSANPGHLLFDLDGTLSDPRQGIFSSFAITLAALGRAPARQQTLSACIGPPLEACFSRLLDTEDSLLISRAVQIFRDYYGQSGLFANILHPEIVPLLQGLHKNGRKLFVVTAKKEAFARRILHHFHLDIFLTDIIGASANQPGDKGTLIAELIGRHNLSAPDTIMIGDRSHDMIGARANGLDRYGVLWGFGSRRELEDAGATQIFATPAELHAFLLYRPIAVIPPH